MSIARLVATAALALLSAGLTVSASGRMALYGVVDRVVLEPNEQAPTRIQLWGAFAYGDLTPATMTPQKTESAVRRGHVYFKLPDDQASRQAALAEWRDLKSVAGTGQAVAFGLWGYVSYFSELDPYVAPAQPTTRSVANGQRANAGAPVNLQIKDGRDALGEPVEYTPNEGVIRLPESGSRAAIVKALKTAPSANGAGR
jgi:hypothetical protein